MGKVSIDAVDLGEISELRATGPEILRRRAEELAERMERRRTVRHFSPKEVPVEVITDCLRIAKSAPSGANQQPWHFVAIKSPEIRRQIRIAAEEEEKAFYDHRAPKEWLRALRPFGTSWEKPFLETAPWLIAIFCERYGIDEQGRRIKHYYANESVGIATGFLISALHQVGLSSLTHTPSPMKFLNDILGRPIQEKPFLLLVTGYPADDAKVPRITKKTLEETTTFL